MHFFIFPKILTPPQAPLHPVTACQSQSLPPPLPHAHLAACPEMDCRPPRPPAAAVTAPSKAPQPLPELEAGLPAAPFALFNFSTLQPKRLFFFFKVKLQIRLPCLKTLPCHPQSSSQTQAPTPRPTGPCVTWSRWLWTLGIRFSLSSPVLSQTPSSPCRPRFGAFPHPTVHSWATLLLRGRLTVASHGPSPHPTTPLFRSSLLTYFCCYHSSESIIPHTFTTDVFFLSSQQDHKLHQNKNDVCVLPAVCQGLMQGLAAKRHGKAFAN